MSASPVVLNPVHSARDRSNWNARTAWLPVVYALVFISFTSTAFMGGTHTQVLVNAVWKAVLGTWHSNLTGQVNGIGRKVGHFFGYGLVSLIFRNAWYKSAQALSWVARIWLTPFAAFFAIASTFAVACLDEWHQTFVPGRVGSLHDALLDAAGAIFLNAIFWASIARSGRRHLKRARMEA